MLWHERKLGSPHWARRSPSSVRTLTRPPLCSGMYTTSLASTKNTAGPISLVGYACSESTVTAVAGIAHPSGSCAQSSCTSMESDSTSPEVARATARLRPAGRHLCYYVNDYRCYKE
jgi:hypothetical protein